MHIPSSKKLSFLFSPGEKRSSSTEQDGNQGENVSKEVCLSQDRHRIPRLILKQECENNQAKNSEDIHTHIYKCI